MQKKNSCERLEFYVPFNSIHCKCHFYLIYWSLVSMFYPPPPTPPHTRNQNILIHTHLEKTKKKTQNNIDKEGKKNGN